MNDMSQFQFRVHDWMLACFGSEVAADRRERGHRYLEESLELAQAIGCTLDEAHQLVDYVFGRPVGDPGQEIGGVMLTLAALCTTIPASMLAEGEIELQRVNTEEMIAKIRAKHMSKPLPGYSEPARPERYLNSVDGKVYVLVSENADLVTFKREGRDTLRHLGRDEFARRFRFIPSSPDAAPLSSAQAMYDVIAERLRQQDQEGWTPEHDDGYRDNELARAAACYAIGVTAYWPFDIEWFKPGARRRDLVKAGALILAAIEQIDRAAKPEVQR